MTGRIRRGAAVLLLAALLPGATAGCGMFGNTEIVLTTGLSGDQLFKVGKSVCTLPQAMIYVMDYQRQYEEVYGEEMWEHDFGGMTLEEYAKEMIVSQLASMKAVTLLADDYETALDEEEKELASQAADDYYEALNEEQIAYMKLERADVQQLAEDLALSEKVYGAITKDVNTEVSDDEARIITVQQIHLDSLENAQNVMEKLQEGKDFGATASAYSKDAQTTFTLGRGERDAAYEAVAFALENDQVSDIFEAEDGFYILKCVNNFDQEATEANKTAMVEKRRDDIFGSVYEKLVADTPSEFNSKLWEKVSFSAWTGEWPPSFQEIYKSYFNS